MLDNGLNDLLAAQYVKEAQQWADNEHLIDLAKQHAAARRQPRRNVVRQSVADALRIIARRLAPVGA